jgi:hypothetical protein
VRFCNVGYYDLMCFNSIYLQISHGDLVMIYYTMAVFEWAFLLPTDNFLIVRHFQATGQSAHPHCVKSSNECSCTTFGKIYLFRLLGREKKLNHAR